MGLDAMILVFWMLSFKPAFSLCLSLSSRGSLDYLGRFSYLSLLCFVTLHSYGYIFPFLLCLKFLFFSQLFVRPPQTSTLPFCISFSWGWFWSLPHVWCYKPASIVLQALFLSDLNPCISLDVTCFLWEFLYILIFSVYLNFFLCTSLSCLNFVHNEHVSYFKNCKLVFHILTINATSFSMACMC